jgi:hypothetical protein
VSVFIYAPRKAPVVIAQSYQNTRKAPVVIAQSYQNTRNFIYLKRIQ